MSEERKTIQFNPELFKISEKSKTQKKRSQKTTPKIRIKTPEKSTHNNTLKNRYLKYIREKQQKEYDKIFDENKKKNNTDLSSSSDDNITLSITDIKLPSTTTANSFSSMTQSNEKINNFIESVEYLQNISNQNERKQNEKINSSKTTNNTQYFESISPGVFAPINIEPYPPIYKEEFDTNATLDNLHSPATANWPSTTLRSDEKINIQQNNPGRIRPPSPKYGCLKNGCLPTYRTYMNKSRSSLPQISTSTTCSPEINSFGEGAAEAKTEFLGTNCREIGTSSENCKIIEDEKYSEVERSKLPSQATVNSFSSTLCSDESLETKCKEIEKRIEEKNHLLEKIKNIPSNALKTAKRKKTIKRTFNIGRSGIYSKIGVLIKNRTLRNRITTQKQLLKQAKIDDIKMYLIKNGLIKVGTTAPNDVLRQMYESAVMIGGEVHNYNVESLLHNYLNS
jgi:hypothetical protein